MRLFAFGMICLVFAGVGHAQTLRDAVLQKGDIIVIGNTLAQDCAPGVPGPLVGTIGSCGTNTADTAPDVFWRSNAPSAGNATADVTITNAQARSQAILVLPPGAVVSRAYLYWTGRNATASNITLGRPGAFTAAYAPDDSWVVTFSGPQYTAVADVTSDVAFFGPGTWEVAGVTSSPLANLNDSVIATSWWMVVTYFDPSAPRRSLLLYDEFTPPIVDGVPANLTSPLIEYTVPGTVSADVVVLDGDDGTTGDTIRANGGLVVNALNPVNNVFNSTHTLYGTPVSEAGDLPRLTGGPRTMSGLDLDRFDLTTYAPTATSALMLELATTNDAYLPQIVAISAPAAELPDLLFSDSFED